MLLRPKLLKNQRKYWICGFENEITVNLISNQRLWQCCDSLCSVHRPFDCTRHLLCFYVPCLIFNICVVFFYLEIHQSLSQNQMCCTGESSGSTIVRYSLKTFMFAQLPLWPSKVYCHFHRNPPPNPILGWLSPIHTHILTVLFYGPFLCGTEWLWC
jgi:hypothetical protein